MSTGTQATSDTSLWKVGTASTKKAGHKRLNIPLEVNCPFSFVASDNRSRQKLCGASRAFLQLANVKLQKTANTKTTT